MFFGTPAVEKEGAPVGQGPNSAAARYAKHKEKQRRQQAKNSESGRDIAPLPKVVNQRRRKRCEKHFGLFCTTYLPHTFDKPWSNDHLKAIAKIEQAVLQGGQFAYAMPRGSGKTSLAEAACLWALIYGHRQFVVLIGSDESSALEMLESIKVELEVNDLLFDDFPAVCYPIRCLEGIAHRANGQLLEGVRTHIGWTAKEIVLPTVSGSKASGGIVKVAGLTGRIRGMKYKRPDGRAVRPSLVVLDDPQTDESARSLTQIQQRERIAAGAVLGLAGPGKKIAAVMPCTVIARNDMADRLLDRQLHPAWQGERAKMVYSFPTAETLWEEYAKIRADGMRAGDGGAAGTDFYRAHQVEMDAGAVVAWQERRNPDELSAIQHAMNLRLANPEAFAAEYQNEPLEEARADDEAIPPETIARKVNGRGRGEVPDPVSRITAFVDVQKNALFWIVCGWEDDFSGYVLDYGVWPDQKKSYFAYREVKRTISLVTKAAGLEESIYAALEAITDQLLGREWHRDDGAAMRVERCLVDANWGDSTDVIYRFCRQSRHSALLLPSHGRYVGASSIPFSEYKRKRGDRVGQAWRMPNVAGKRAVRYMLFDTNWWKSFVMGRWAVGMGGRGCLSLFGRDGQDHRLFSEHVTAEEGVRTEGRGRTVTEWKLRPNRDNHWLDCLVGCAVAASERGVSLVETVIPSSMAGRKRVKLSELQAMRSRGGSGGGGGGGVAVMEEEPETKQAAKPEAAAAVQAPGPDEMAAGTDAQPPSPQPKPSPPPMPRPVAKRLRLSDLQKAKRKP